MDKELYYGEVYLLDYYKYRKIFCRMSDYATFLAQEVQFVPAEIDKKVIADAMKVVEDYKGVLSDKDNRLFLASQSLKMAGELLDTEYTRLSRFQLKILKLLLDYVKEHKFIRENTEQLEAEIELNLED